MTEVVYTLDTLEYLARGGRIGRVKAMAGALLHLKPVIRVDDDGKYTTVATTRTIGKGLATITEHLFAKYANAPLWVTVLHGRFADQAEALSTALKEKLNIGRLEVKRISPVLGVHTGPGIVGAAVLPLAAMQDLM
jgi:DegV family protein with EDD domain